MLVVALRRKVMRRAAVLGLGALLLASCASPARSTSLEPLVSGTPTLSISVPLSNVSCTRNDVCVTAGTISTINGPNTVAEYATPHGKWFNLTLPASPSPIITSSACSDSACLIGGSSQGHDLLWSVSTATHQLSVVIAPSGGVGVLSLDCRANLCVLIDNNNQGDTRFSISSNAGLTWSVPQNVSWPSSDAVTTVTCASTSSCVVGTLSNNHVFTLYVTTNAGASWSSRPTPSAWATMNSLNCAARQCVGLAQTSGGSFIVRSKNFARSWTSEALTGRANALACTTFSSCVVVGQRSESRAWLATIQKRVITNVRLRYVPTPLVNVACGSTMCAAIGSTTVLTTTLNLKRSS
ncbi:MAG: WD40/YVTN/BNR-like repeat-containing protein [Acidimicrobiales bacterium]